MPEHAARILLSADDLARCEEAHASTAACNAATDALEVSVALVIRDARRALNRARCAFGVAPERWPRRPVPQPVPTPQPPRLVPRERVAP